MFKKILAILSCISVLALAGCATPASMEGMTSHVVPATPIRSKSLLKSVSVKQVQGGESTNPMWMSEVGNQAFKEALINSLQFAHLYSTISESRYHLSANLLELKKPWVGLDLTDTCKIHYQLMDVKTKTMIFNQDITTSYTAKFGDAFFATERLRLANEGAVRTNIKQFVADLYALTLK